MRKPMSKYRHMTREKAEEMRALFFSGQLKRKELAQKFQVSEATVSRVISGLIWNVRKAH
jgi:DNA-binding transcriptional regulator LsrR (DeoR family)